MVGVRLGAEWERVGAGGAFDYIHPHAYLHGYDRVEPFAFDAAGDVLDDVFRAHTTAAMRTFHTDILDARLGTGGGVRESIDVLHGWDANVLPAGRGVYRCGGADVETFGVLRGHIGMGGVEL